jgi:hypothetical protein
MTKPFERRHDIPIGPDLWIKYVEVDGRQKRAVSLDPWILPIQPFWDALEVNCVKDCCGIDAFSLFPEDLRNARTSVEPTDLQRTLQLLHSMINESESDIFVSNCLNNYFDRKVVLELVEHILQHIA